jgi:hypothetical protein
VDRLELGVVVNRRGHLELAQRAMQPGEMAGEVESLPRARGHLVDPVGEEEAAVEDRDLRLLLGQVAPLT